MQKLRLIQDTRQDVADTRNVSSDELALFPFPEGWYFVADRRSVEKKQLIQKQWLGQDIVAWCDNEGAVCVAQSVCPHMGSSLGPAAGGRVRDGRLVCPFHGFAYDVAGTCVATPYADPPKSARLNVFHTREVLGLIFAWWGLDGRPPQWSLPEEPATGDDWSGLEIRTLRFPGHPQETTENSVDIAHLKYVHGYDNVNAVGSATVDGPLLVSRFDFKSRRRIAGHTAITYDFSVTAYVHGLGYSYVETLERTIGMEIRLWVLATPVDGTFIDLVLASQVRDMRKPKQLIAGLGFLPVKLRTRILSKILISMQKRDVLQDVVIWGRKSYRPHPSLCRSDGAIGKYRRYCRQFYPDGHESGVSPRGRTGGSK
ncbi:MAG: Rieske 2Fe-2S domain-containing protein [Gammaproteobacteria bacterium]|nr:Rieske 2Fe-2S domain-containing protein [Gammaproteobacteria bacterium]